ncbi:D-tagatose-bisphosphate aldolase, class II, non-catalytic subunit [Buchananella hordeovulneris]|uniref:D-tagatose-bisphosphate aldolase, class II, non-catalytic subunit n=1 Tax=Buchananella hordeovulneris TaxID=52770 RepID=UPI000F5DCF1A|nr:D-tagatose-bisphosphate aldolase, class II, non-catalytic subunit [Buchananella hordeovulneris]RRD44131.1 D-tagatose-bisphosphate aldolase, class II, non-catalytic subunit [Buchananella hordeovulneris]
MTNPFGETIAAHKAGAPVGIYSVCSAHPLVLRAAIDQALADDAYVLIEATSNQVDQFGGYTGMQPADFRDLVYSIADEAGLARDRVVLGGDHLGPNRWQGEEPESAMAKADDLVAAYVEAGYTKIHLDCSFSCAGDPFPITDEIAAERAARLLKVAEEAAARAGTAGQVRYVIGTEVPVPGGHAEELGVITPTSKEAAAATLAAHRAAFERVGLTDIWPRIAALVVQPAVEFDHLKVIDYVSAGTAQLRTVLDDEPTLVFEAHSTDYQTPENLAQLVRDHWAILKVGPGLTFNLREGLFALAKIEDELVAPDQRSRLIDVIEEVMVAEPGYWQKYYEGDAAALRLARRFSYSDRMRYYWPNEQISAAVETLLANLDQVGIPEPLVSQFLPLQYARVRAGQLELTAKALLLDKVRDAMRPYAAACFPTK